MRERERVDSGRTKRVKCSICIYRNALKIPINVINGKKFLLKSHRSNINYRKKICTIYTNALITCCCNKNDTKIKSQVHTDLFESELSLHIVQNGIDTRLKSKKCNSMV